MSRSLSSGDNIVCDGTEAGLHAAKLIVAKRVFAEEFGLAPRRVASIALCARLPQLLVKAQRDCSAQAQFALLPASPNGSTVRLTRDGRNLMRNTLADAGRKQIDEDLLAQARSNHLERIAVRWPHLTSVELAST